MEVRLLKSIYGGGVSSQRGEVIDVPQNRGRQLVAKGYAVAVNGKPVIPQANDGEEKEAANDNAPFTEPQTGGSTGGGKQQSASQAGRQQRKPRSTSQKGDAA